MTKISFKPESLPLTFASYKAIINSILKGKTITRSFINQSLKEINLTGEIIDLGSGSSRPSYYNYLKLDEKANLTFTDFYKSAPHVKKVDLEQKLPLKANHYDYVLLFNVIGLIHNHAQLIAEISRILKPGGTLVGAMPFMGKLHPDPKDYSRLTDTSYRQLAADTGLKVTKIIYLGSGPFTASVTAVNEILPTFMIVPAVSLAFLLDRFILNRSEYHHCKYPLGYTFILTKPKS